MTKTFEELLESVNPGDTVTGFLKADLKTIHHQELQKAREVAEQNLLAKLQAYADKYELEEVRKAVEEMKLSSEIVSITKGEAN